MSLNTSNATFLPNGAATGLGSLPFVDPEHAVGFVGRMCPRVPFWPRLPQRSEAEGQVAQGLSPLLHLLRPCRRRTGAFRPSGVSAKELATRLNETPAELNPAHAAGFFTFVQALQAGRFDQALAVKGQMLGPLTLASRLCLDPDGEHPFILDRELTQAVVNYATRLAAWQVRRLRHRDLPVLLFVDDPVMAAIPPEAVDDWAVDAIDRVVQSIHDEGGLAGLRCPMAASTLALHKVNPDLLSLDARASVNSVCCSPALRQLAKRRTHLSFGMIPTTRQNPPTAREHFAQWLTTASLLGKADDLAPRTLVTTACGLGRTDARTAETAFAVGRRLANRIAQIAR